MSLIDPPPPPASIRKAEEEVKERDLELERIESRATKAEQKASAAAAEAGARALAEWAAAHSAAAWGGAATWRRGDVGRRCVAEIARDHPEIT